MIINWNNIAVGIIGLVEDWLNLCPNINSDEVKYLDIFESARNACIELRNDGAEVLESIIL